MDLDTALSEIGEIRSRLVSQSFFQGFGPIVVCSMGVLSIVVALLQLLVPERLAANARVYVLVWIATALVGAAIVTVHVLLRTRKVHGKQSGAMLSRLFEQLMPAVFAALAVSVSIFLFAPSFLNALPGLWQMFAALAVFTVAASLGRGIRMVAAWYFMCGTVTFAVGLQQLDVVLSPWVMAIPFAIGQFALASVLTLEYRRF